MEIRVWRSKERKLDWKFFHSSSGAMIITSIFLSKAVKANHRSSLAVSPGHMFSTPHVGFMYQPEPMTCNSPKGPLHQPYQPGLFPLSLLQNPPLWGVCSAPWWNLEWFYTCLLHFTFGKASLDTATPSFPQASWKWYFFSYAVHLQYCLRIFDFENEKNRIGGTHKDR